MTIRQLFILGVFLVLSLAIGYPCYAVLPNLLVLESGSVLEYDVDPLSPTYGYVGILINTTVPHNIITNQGFTLGPNGNLFITNGNTDSVLEWDINTGDLVGEYGDTDNLVNPRQLGFDSAGNLYVADHGGNVIRKYDPAGTSLGSLTDSTGAMTSGPWGLAIDENDNVYVNLWNNTSNPSSVLKFDGVDTFVPLNTGAAYAVKQGLGIAYRDGFVYPVSAGYGAVRKLSTDGTVQTNYTYGTAQVTIVDIVFDDLDRGYLAGINSHDVRRYDINGTYIDTIAAQTIAGDPIATPIGVLFKSAPPLTCADMWAMGFGSEADLNKDCQVDYKDLAIFSSYWMQSNDPHE